MVFVISFKKLKKNIKTLFKVLREKRLSKVLDRKKLVLKQKLNMKLIAWAKKMPRRSSLYYFLFSKQFDKEHQSVLRGRYRYLKKSPISSSDIATLRRNIHNIEKGLTVDMPMYVFAKNYIVETVKIFSSLLNDINVDHDLLKWSFDVLNKYFMAVNHEDQIKEAHKIFNCIPDARLRRLLSDNRALVPFPHKDNSVSKVDYDNFLELCFQRRSVRWYEDREVDFDIVNKAIKAGLTAPSAYNCQAFRFLLVRNPERLSRISSMPLNIEDFAHNLMFLIVIIGDLSAYFNERDRHLIYTDGGLVAMNIMMALETLGLSSCPIYWPEIEDRERSLAKEFNLHEHERCIMFMSVGYPLKTGNVLYSAKKSIKEVCSYY